MLNLPTEFKNKIINRYSSSGNEWLINIDSIINKYIEMFQLTNLKLIENLTMNIVLTASSEKYGDVILKILSPSKNSIDEIKFVKYCSSNYMVKCYFYDIKDRIMILERIKPGYCLNTLENREKRIKVFCDIVNNFTTSNLYLKNFKTYDNMLIEKINDAKHNINIDSDIICKLSKAQEIYKEISNMNLPKYVLHDDLQHRNILKCENGWKVIDPHGIVGEKVLETSHFIKAELELIDRNTKHLNELVHSVSKYINEDISLVYKALYITIITKLIFYIKGGYNPDYIKYNLNLCNILIKYID